MPASPLRPVLFALLLPVFLLTSCGRDGKSDNYNISLNGHAIVRAVYANNDPGLKDRLDATVACLLGSGQRTRHGYPLVLVVDGIFNCNGVAARGCAEIEGTSIYMTEQYLYTAVFAHEVVHWETGMGNEYHGTPQFTHCCPED